MSDLVSTAASASVIPPTTMAAPAPAPPVGPDTLITIKILHNGLFNRRFKIPLRDLGARIFPQKIRYLLSIPVTDSLVLERYSDSLANFILLDSENPAVYKQLYRAAKAKLKLRIKVTTKPLESPELPAAVVPPVEEAPVQEQSQQRFRFLDTVLSPSPTLSASDIPKAMTSPVSIPPRPSSPVPSSVHEEKQEQQPEPEPEPEPEQQQQSPPSPQPLYPLRFSNASHISNAFCIDCNNCGKSIPNEHYHCSICDNGDYDLCVACVDAGVTCPGDRHWMLKRLVQNGCIINSVTDIASRLSNLKPFSTEKFLAEYDQANLAEKETVVPEKPETKDEKEAEEEQSKFDDERTCNACFRELSEKRMVHCDDCPDYDLCTSCLLKNNHGHNPAHNFSVIHNQDHNPYGPLPNLVFDRCRPGRHYRHAAICDGCDRRITGVRHKCLSCPDWDYCWSCFKQADETHPNHRFVPIYGAIAEPRVFNEDIHYGIFCDGPLCRTKTSSQYISGVRYKCAVCHDTDFCAACEALPTNTHNRTHPLIKMRTAVRNVTVSTLGGDAFGAQTMVMGDRSPPAVAPSVQESLQDSTVVEAPSVVEKTEPKLPDEVVPELTVAEPPLPVPVSGNNENRALLMRETIPDGTFMPPAQVFKKSWTLYNPGPETWPVGTCLHYVGGSVMFDIDTEHSSSIVALSNAMSSTKLTQPLAPSQEADFTVMMRSPYRPGAAESYWRLRLPSGETFGPRLWCEIEVTVTAKHNEDDVETLTVAEIDASIKALAAKTEAETETATESKSDMAGSDMVFPKLEKESPVSSTHEALTERPAPVSVAPSVAPSVSAIDDHSLAEDVESLTLEESDDGFFTDEEYDILDASDQESVAEKH